MKISLLPQNCKKILWFFYGFMIFYVSPLEAQNDSCLTLLKTGLNKQTMVSSASCTTAKKLLTWFLIQETPHQFSFQEITNFLQQNPDWPKQAQLAKIAENSIDEKTSKNTLLAWFDKNPPLTANGASFYIKALKKTQNLQRAQQIAKTTWHTIAMSQEEERNFMLSFSSLLTSNDHEKRVDNFLWEEKVDAASRLLSYLSPQARNMAKKRISLLKKQPPHDLTNQKLAIKTPGLAYDLAKWHRKQKNYDMAGFYILQHQNPTHHQDFWGKERTYIGREFLSQNRYKEAYKVVAAHGLSKGEVFSNCEWFAGWVALRFLKQADTAYKHFTTLYNAVKSPLSLSRGAYWAGRAAESKKDSKQAAIWYQKGALQKTTFYGQLSAAKLKQRIYPKIIDDSTIPLEIKKNFSQKSIVQATRLLVALGPLGKSYVRPFLMRIAEKATTTHDRNLAILLASQISPHDIVWTAKTAIKNQNYQLSILKQAFPLKRVGPMQNGLSIEQALVMSIIYQESRFDPTAISSAGARGLMQLMPKTAKKNAEWLNMSFREDKLLVPDYNITLGTYYLSHLVEKFSGSYILATAAYNAGSTPVGRWVQQFGDPRSGNVDIIDWIESIPYYETRNYVQRVLELVTVYRSLSGPVKRTLIEDLQHHSLPLAKKE